MLEGKREKRRGARLTHDEYDLGKYTRKMGKKWERRKRSRRVGKGALGYRGKGGKKGLVTVRCPHPCLGNGEGRGIPFPISD